MTQLHELTISAAAGLIKTREISPVDLVQALLDRIEQLDGLLNTYITVCAVTAMEMARVAEAEIRRGEWRGPLHGIPVSHKDNSWTKGVRTTAHSKTMMDHIPDQDATHVRRLAEAGMILLGKTNTTEFATGDMHVFGDVPNPWDMTRFAGSSSGGSASALAAGLAIAATGTDTGGSIRFPASTCGIVGVKPTYGRVSRYGIVPLSWTMDHVGPMARTVQDAALMLNVMAGSDARDPHTAHEPVPDFTSDLTERLDGLVLGIPANHYYEALDLDVDHAMQVALGELAKLGARLEPVALPMAGQLRGIGAIIVECEAYALHAERLRRQAQDYGPRTRQIAAGGFFSAAEYLEALQLRQIFNLELARSFASVDAMITPTLPFTAYTREVERDGPPDTSWGTRQFNFSGYPAMSIPCGFDSNSLPIGMQIIARPFDEQTMFRVGHAYEKATAWHERRPEIAEVSHA